MCDTGASIEGPFAVALGPSTLGQRGRALLVPRLVSSMAIAVSSERDEVALVGFKEVDDETKAVSEAFMDRRRAGPNSSSTKPTNSPTVPSRISARSGTAIELRC